MNILRNFLAFTIPQFFKNSEVRREVCKIASVCGGGSSGASWGGITGDIQDQTDLIDLLEQSIPDLQMVTTGSGNNLTSNTLQLTGLDNFNAGTESMLLAYSSGEGIISKTNTIGNGTISLLGDGTIKVLVGNSSSNTLSDILLLQDTTGLGDNIATFSARVKVQNAIEDDDAVNLGQLNGLMASPNVVTTNTTGALEAGEYYTYTGTEAATFTFPELPDSVGKRIGFINDSAFVVTLTSNDGVSTEIMSNGTKLADLGIEAGNTNVFYNNSIAWVAIA